MPRATLPALTLLLCLCGSRSFANSPRSAFELREGDRVVLVGGTFIEREQSHGYWEAAFTTAYPDRQITFRNLGWSGDTVWGESRGLFEPHLGYQQLVEQVQATEPTVLILGYGQNEAGRGPAGVEEFSRQYEKLLQDVAADGVRCVLLSPLEYAVHGSRSASASELDDHNQTIELYARAIRELAARRGDVYVDFRPDQSTGAPGAMRDFGEIFSAGGYRWTAARWLRHLEGPQVEQVATLLAAPDDPEAFTALREAILIKNELFFHRWRPQNFTYLYGFREHEQGQNAAEVPRFDPLIAAAEDSIARLRRASNGSTPSRE